ncbi:unnamed protein product [Lupinus luteus]|uniref:Uncharacterized protein n=1 Tax=Lupinus luteus TaxID=3873 RepID=A0AAV1XJI0_LUPLU
MAVLRRIHRVANDAANCLACTGAAELVSREHLMIVPLPELETLIMRDAFWAT